MKKTLFYSILLAAFLNLLQAGNSYLAASRAHFVVADAASAPARQADVRPVASSAKASPASAAAPDPAVAATTKLQAAGLQPEYAALYLAASAQTGTPWQLLAAVHEAETGQRGDTAVRSYAGAVGPMQFLPSTFNRYAVDGDHDGAARITDLEDAMYTAGRYLATGGADHGRYRDALYRYNHSASYVNHVLAIAGRLGL